MSQQPTEPTVEAPELSPFEAEWDSSPAQARPSNTPPPWPVVQPSDLDIASRRPTPLWALVVAASLIPLAVGSAAGYVVAANIHTANPVQTAAQQYARVRTANIGPLEQALSHVATDCSEADVDRCRLSIAYALALTQKFQAELLPAPSCAASSDAKLQSALTELDSSLHAAAADNALGSLPLAGETGLAESDALFNAEACATG